jgi:hypothetical protein
MSLLLLALLMAGQVHSASGLVWEYQEIGSLEESGPYDSAAKIDDVVAVAGKQGVWLWTRGESFLSVSCYAQPDHPNRVRLLDLARFIASTPCGLFVIKKDGKYQKLGFPSLPGAIAVNDLGLVVVAAESSLWLMSPKKYTRRWLYDVQWPPSRLEFEDNLLLVYGEQYLMLDLQGGRNNLNLALQMHPVLMSEGRLHIVGPQGNRWIGSFTKHLVEQEPLNFEPGEKIFNVQKYRKGVFVILSSQWFFIEQSERTKGYLPSSYGHSVVIVGDYQSELPWLAVDGKIFKPVQKSKQKVRLRCSLPALKVMLQSAFDAQGLKLPEKLSVWQAFLPKLNMSLGGNYAYKEVHYDTGALVGTSLSEFSGYINLAWDFDELLLGSAKAHSGLIEDVRKHRKRLEFKVVAMRRAWQKECERGTAGQEQIETYLNILTWGER